MTAIDDELRVLDYRGAHADYRLAVWARETLGWLVCRCVFPARVPALRRAVVAELAARINYELPIGGFDLDMRDGEVRFRYGMDLEGGAPGDRVVPNMLRYVLYACERHHDAIMAVAFGGESPEAAMEGLPPLGRAVVGPAAETDDDEAPGANDRAVVERFLGEIAVRPRADG